MSSYEVSTRISLIAVLFFAQYATSQPCNSTGPSCVSSCNGLALFQSYQWCQSCTSFLYCDDVDGGTHYPTCSNGWKWNDCVKRCVSGVSPTCLECYEDGGSVPGCNPDVTEQTSTVAPGPTAPPALCNTTGPSCITSCQGLTDGEYQWCGGCLYYVSCTAGQGTIRSCPVHSPWDDCTKRCETSTNTCVECYTGSDEDIDCSEGTKGTSDPVIEVTTPPVVQCNSTGPACFRSCGGLPDGNYQYCGNCHSFLTCTNDVTFFNACPSGLVWDDLIKGCDRESTTCTECFSMLKRDDDSLEEEEEAEADEAEAEEAEAEEGADE